MYNFGFFELLIIFAIIVFAFGAKKLPKLGESAGQALRNFKEGYRGLEDDAEETEEEDNDSSK